MSDIPERPQNADAIEAYLNSRFVQRNSYGHPLYDYNQSAGFYVDCFCGQQYRIPYEGPCRNPNCKRVISVRNFG